MNIIKIIENLVGVENLEELSVRKQRMIKNPENFLFTVFFRDVDRAMGIGFSSKSQEAALSEAIECYKKNKGMKA